MLFEFICKGGATALFVSKFIHLIQPSLHLLQANASFLQVFRSHGQCGKCREFQYRRRPDVPQLSELRVRDDAEVDVRVAHQFDNLHVAHIKQRIVVSEVEREICREKLRQQLPMLRGAVGASQVDIANAIGISRQTYNAIESGRKEMNWSIYCSLLLYFDYHPNAHTIIHQLNIFPSWLENTRLYIDANE